MVYFPNTCNGRGWEPRTRSSLPMWVAELSPRAVTQLPSICNQDPNWGADPSTPASPSCASLCQGSLLFAARC